MNVFRDSLIRNSTMLVCGMILGAIQIFEFLERDPFSPWVALVGVLVGFFSVSVRQCIQNGLLSMLGYISSFVLVALYKGIVLVSSGADLAAMVEKLAEVVVAGAMVSPVVHLTWILAVPMGYGLRRMIKGERRVKKGKSPRPSRRSS